MSDKELELGVQPLDKIMEERGMKTMTWWRRRKTD